MKPPTYLCRGAEAPLMMRRTYSRVALSLVRETTPAPYMATGADVASLLRQLPFADDPREHFIAIYLDGRHRVMAVHTVSVGGPTAASVHPREVFGPALQLAASAIVMAHNHPSGDPVPSRDDKLITDRLREVGLLVGIEVLDHIIIGTNSYFSFADESVHRS
jgi:DNA repair protein RadC